MIAASKGVSHTFAGSDHVRLLDVTDSSSHVSAVCFYWLRFASSRDSTDVHSISSQLASLVHAFVTSRVDYCNTVLAGVMKSTCDKLQRVLNAAACFVSRTHKFYTVASHIYCLLICTGLMYRSDSNTNTNRCTSVCDIEVPSSLYLMDC